jgi:hypothetical protein
MVYQELPNVEPGSNELSGEGKALAGSAYPCPHDLTVLSLLNGDGETASCFAFMSRRLLALRGDGEMIVCASKASDMRERPATDIGDENMISGRIR